MFVRQSVKPVRHQSPRSCRLCLYALELRLLELDARYMTDRCQLLTIRASACNFSQTGVHALPPLGPAALMMARGPWSCAIHGIALRKLQDWSGAKSVPSDANFDGRIVRVGVGGCVSKTRLVVHSRVQIALRCDASVDLEGLT